MELHIIAHYIYKPIAEPAILQGLISAIICVFRKLAGIDSFIRNPKLTCI